jgi:hypothetical protein
MASIKINLHYIKMPSAKIERSPSKEDAFKNYKNKFTFLSNFNPNYECLLVECNIYMNTYFLNDTSSKDFVEWRHKHRSNYHLQNRLRILGGTRNRTSR